MTHIQQMSKPLHTVAQLDSFLASADRAGMTDAEKEKVVETVAADPEGGDLIVGSGGVRKVRIAGRGFGKSGGYRVATGFLGLERPVYLIWVLSKGKASNFTDEQIKVFRSLMERLRSAGKVVPKSRKEKAR